MRLTFAFVCRAVNQESFIDQCLTVPFI